MEKDLNKQCACKGIRSCLTCEKDKGISKCGSSLKEEDLMEYTFCHSCGLCWPDVKLMNDYSEFKNIAFHLPGILLIHDFITKEEEREIASNIDQISWVPSQSGRRKQDFGPKVNFKKHKVKIGEFSGFPEFTGFLIERLASVPSLSGFLPVELCNLEYCPERGSAIEPHVDDFWLWGERLITLNLLSSTVLTLTSMDACQCKPQHKNKNDIDGDLSNSKKEFFMDNNCECDHLSLVQDQDENHPHVSVTDSCFSPLDADLRNGTVTGNHFAPAEGHQIILKSDSSRTIILPDENEFSEWGSKKRSEKIVRIPLPPRSLLVLFSCARYHWLHAISRSDINERRLAMTFRELTQDFLPGGSQFELGKELLDIAKVQVKS